MKNKRHILILASWYKTDKKEVGSPFIEEHAISCLNTGYKVSVMHPHFIGGFKKRLACKTEKLVSRKNDNGIEVWHYGDMSIIPYFRSIIYNHFCKNADHFFSKYVQENGIPDVIHAHSTFMGGVFANFLSIKYNIPYIITEHASKLILDYKSLFRTEKNIVKTILNNSAKTIFVSNFQKEKMLSLYNISNGNSEVVPNALNPIFSYTPINNIKYFTICIVGCLNENKNHKLLFEAVKQLKQRKYYIRIKVIGNGLLLNSLKKYILKENLSDQILFYGAMNKFDVFKQIIDSHCLISVSKFETFGISIIEGLAVGRPVIATNSGGPAEIINLENGLLLSTFKASELADQILKLKKSYDSYNLKKISDNCIMKYAENIIYPRIFRILESAIENNKK